MRLVLAVFLTLLLLAFLADAVAVGTERDCKACHGKADRDRTTVEPGPGCTSCHVILPTYIEASVHNTLRNATLIRPTPPLTESYCRCHSTGRAMSPSCVCHVVIHINLENHGFQYPYPVAVFGYLPWGISYPSVKPGVEYKFARLLYDCNVYCPPNLLKIWQEYSTSSKITVVALWDWSSGDVILPLPGPGPASIGGAYEQLEADSWKSCFVCHIAAVDPWTVVAGYNGTPVTGKNPDTAYVQHSDLCQPCHGASRFSKIDGRVIWEHNIIGYIYGGPNAVWGNCGECHVAIAQKVSQSIHWGLGCKCHTVVHFGYVYQDNWLATLYTYEGTGAGVETAQSIVRLAKVYTPANATSGVLYLFYNMSQVAGPGRNVELGLWDPYTNDFITTLSFPAASPRFGNPGLGPSRVWQACLGCHFLSVDPSTVSDPHGIKWSFSVREWDVETSGVLPQLDGGERRTTSFLGVAIAILLLLGGFIILARRAK